MVPTASSRAMPVGSASRFWMLGPVVGRHSVALIECPYLGGQVELTDEREKHIAEHHPDLLPEHRERIMETVSDPDQVRRSSRMRRARMFTRWFDGLRGGKNVVVVVVSDPGPGGRHWIVTAYIARRLAGGEIEWTRS